MLDSVFDVHSHKQLILNSGTNSISMHSCNHYPERGKVIDVGVHIYICLWTSQKILNPTLAIESPFRTLAVGLLIEFID